MSLMMQEMTGFIDSTKGGENTSNKEQLTPNLCQEMMANYGAITPKYLHDKEINGTKEDVLEEDTKTVAESVSFDGNDSMEFSEERKEAFIEYYNLKLLYECESIVTGTKIYVAPNKAVVYFSNATYAYVLTTYQHNFTKMSDVVELLAKPDVEIEYSQIFKLFENCNSFPDRLFVWEKMRAIARQFGDTCITAELKKYVRDKFLAEVEKCKNAKLPKVGDLVHRINVKGDSSYEDSSLTVVAVYKTYVTLQTEVTGFDINIDVALCDFWNNFESLEQLVPDAVKLFKKVLWTLLDEELVQNLLNVTYTSREPVTVGYSVPNSYYYFSDKLRLTYDSLNYVSIKISSGAEGLVDSWLVGSPLDLPLVVNEYIKNKSDDTRALIWDNKFGYFELVKVILESFNSFFGESEELDELQTIAKRNFDKITTIVTAVG